METITLSYIKEMISKAYGDKYDVIEYVGSKTPIILICKEHGKFILRLDHIRDSISRNKELCPHCKKEILRLKKFDEFVKKAKEIHGDKYIYHRDKFTKMSEKTVITCPIHGDFKQNPINHVTMMQGCPECYNDSKKGSYKHTKEEIIELCKKTHRDNYDYTDIVYQGMKNKILNIRCPKHGYFNQIAYDHIRGFKCEKCKFENQTMTKDEFITRATELHKGFYLYDADKITYVNNHIKVPIICPIHGEFWQRPANHLLGIGCPLCNASKLENEIVSFLNENKIEFIRQFRAKWLKRQSLDFYLPEYQVAIECQGKQHFEEIDFFGRTLDEDKERDIRKMNLCKENGIKLLYFSNLGIKYPYQVYEDKNDLLNEIRGAMI